MSVSSFVPALVFNSLPSYLYSYTKHSSGTSGVTFAGLIADSRTLVERAQIEAQNFWFTYNRKIRIEDVTQSVANLALQFGDDDVKVGGFFQTLPWQKF